MGQKNYHVPKKGKMERRKKRLNINKIEEKKKRKYR